MGDNGRKKAQKTQEGDWGVYWVLTLEVDKFQPATCGTFFMFAPSALFCGQGYFLARRS